MMFTAGNLLPPQVIIVPLYRIYLALPLPRLLSDTGLLYDSYFGIILINIVFQTGFCTFVLSNYMKTISRELTEAALVDGAALWTIYRKVILPLCRPALAALATLEFTFIYNDFFWALVLMKTGDKRPITSALNNFQGSFFTDQNVLAAMSFIVAVPTIVVYLDPVEAVREGTDARIDEGLGRRPDADRRHRRLAARAGAGSSAISATTATRSSTSTSCRDGAPNFEFVLTDLTDAGQVHDVVRGADAIVHFAAIPAPGLRPDNETFRINTVSTWNVFQAAVGGRRRSGGLGVERDGPRAAVRPAAGLRPDRRDDHAAARERPTPCRSSSARRWPSSSTARPASRSSGSGSRTSWSRPTTTGSRAGRTTRGSGSGTCGATSTRGTSRRPAASPSKARRPAPRSASWRPPTP